MNNTRTRFKRAIVLTTLLPAVLGLLVLCGCEYPEQGYHSLMLVSADGDVAASMPFAVEEILDDTFLTLGFNILLPVQGEGRMYEVELRNGAQTNRRYWLFGLSNDDMGLGNLTFELTHISEVLTVEGAYRQESSGPVYKLEGIVESTGQGSGSFVSDIDLPPLDLLGPGYHVKIASITEEGFEKYMGSAMEDAERLKASAIQPLAPTATESTSESGSGSERKRSKSSPPAMGGQANP